MIIPVGSAKTRRQRLFAFELHCPTIQEWLLLSNIPQKRMSTARSILRVQISMRLIPLFEILLRLAHSILARVAATFPI